jgi:transposase
LEGPDRIVRLLVDHRESLVSERTRAICRLPWHLHEIDPGWEPGSRALDRDSAYDAVAEHLAGVDGIVARLARQIVARCRELTVQINQLHAEIADLVKVQAPSLLALPGCGELTAAKILGETAGITRFKPNDAYARHNGTAPLPVWSSNKARHRLSRTGNRQLNAALHRVAMTQAHWHPPAQALMARRKAAGNSGREALRILKRHLSDAVYTALRTNAATKINIAALDRGARDRPRRHFGAAGRDWTLRRSRENGE